MALALFLVGPVAGAGPSDPGDGPGAATSPAAESSDRCILEAGPDATREHEGVTDYTAHLRPQGELHAIMLFVDFDDAPADDEPSVYYDRLSEAADWFSASSYGRLSLDIEPELQWFRMPDPSTDYDMDRDLDFEIHRAYLADAVRVADDSVDFSGYDLLYVVSPESAPEIDHSPALVASPAHGIGARDDDPEADGNVLRFGANISNNVYQRAEALQYRVLVHETGHVFGLPDLYAYEGGQHRFVGGWDVMGNDQGHAPDALTWHKRKLGWLHPSRLVCVAEDGESEHTLSPVEQRGGTKGIVVRTGEDSAYVAEVREPAGVDGDACAEGVLIYQVDSNRESGDGPVRLRTADGNTPATRCARDTETFGVGPDEVDAFFDPDEGVAFEVLGSSDGDYTIRASRGVEQEPPVADAGGPYVTEEGEAIDLDGSGSSDPNPGDELTYEWDLDGDGAFDDRLGETATVITVGRDDVFDIALRVTDKAGATDVDETTLTVENVAPTVEFDVPERVGEGDEIVLTGTVGDAGWLDPLDVTVNWGPGGGTELFPGETRNFPPEATLSFEARHVYGDDGDFTIEVCGHDDDTEACVSDSIEVGNVAPTASIDTDGAVELGGLSVLLAEAGDPVELTGRSTDPGSDDLDLAWDFGDGSPEVSRTSLVNPPDPDGSPSPTVQPRDVTDIREHAFAEACAYEVAFTSADDDGGSASDGLLVLVTGGAERMRGAGYWTHQMRGNGRTDLDRQALECRLAALGLASRLFHDVRDASTPEDALEVLQAHRNGGDMRELFDRQALTAWLNFASGAVGLEDPVDTDGDGEPDSLFGDVLEEAEDVRLDPDADRDDLERQKDVLERINRSG